MTLRLTIPDNPGDQHRDAVIAPLRAYNAETGGPMNLKPVAILLTDADGAEVGGLWGKTIYDWLFVELLAVPEAWRGHGYGQALIAEAERVAREAGCIGLWLDTFEFQARGFYEKLGFEVFGTLEDHPLGSRRYFLKKRFA
jgi:GNAT superfamily N-acetyltransferase